MYCTHVSRTNVRNLLKETTLQMLAKMQRADAFNFKVGLIAGRAASIAVKRVVAKYLELDDAEELALFLHCFYSDYCKGMLIVLDV